MAQKSRPDPGSGNVLNADEYEALALAYTEDGVVGHPSDTAVVYADATGRQVKVRAGKIANVRGYGWFSDATTDEIINNAGVGLPANTSGNPRIDRLVLRLDRAARTVRTVYLQGAPGVTPVAPDLTQDLGLSGGLFDIPLARWQVAAGYTTVAATDIVTEAWYPQPGGLILCTSTSRPFGASLYSGLEIVEIDTGLKQRWFSSQWQRAAWNEAWGNVGGKRWTSGVTLSSLIGTTEAGTNMDTGTLTLLPGRLYLGKVRVNFFTGSAGANWIQFAVKRTGLTGPGAFNHLFPWAQNNSFACSYPFEGMIPDVGAAPITDVWYLTCKRFSGADAITVSAGSASDPTYLYIEDRGPSSKIATG